MSTGENRDNPQAFACSRCSQGNPRLDAAPLPGALGKKIHATICRPCWEEWMALSVMVVNEYRLNLMSPEDGKVYDKYMQQFLGLAE